ncbi:hypothetical protein D8674_006343 [Pyrus ussuriensis x Pyrus communis]|uniref:Uncharacterized protein n=1 Tax=Pyrus ussuriensis x Pyrus communis TaxID=2448454 RepID=A0A5N5FU20_9ROSA|nr:hypothetical protein D8674_006343 [Pyrus ussuriensis x Pyrus communis]
MDDVSLLAHASIIDGPSSSTSSQFHFSRHSHLLGILEPREEMLMVHGSSTLGWSTLIKLLRALTQQIK